MKRLKREQSFEKVISLRHIILYTSKTNLVREISIYVCILKNKNMPVHRVGSILYALHTITHTQTFIVNIIMNPKQSNKL